MDETLHEKTRVCFKENFGNALRVIFLSVVTALKQATYNGTFSKVHSATELLAMKG